ncbi:MAG: hypothetical protein IKI77_10875, partial [Oscillospiraceae bacterium]|nr:hypothetical protein [Oscillospiraceae bacterium]
AVEESRVEATCTTDGSYNLVVYCETCGEEVSRETVVIPATGHTPAEAVEESRVEATCTTDGSYDLVVYCETCGEVVSRETVVIPATGHNYGEPVWSWNGFESAEVTLTCPNGCGETEVLPATITSETTEAGLATAGKTVYTATATDEEGNTYTDTKEEAIAPTFIIKQNHSLLVDGRIGVNYLVQFAGEVENPVMTAWHMQEDGEWIKTEVAGEQNLTEDGEWDGRYVFTYMVAAPEMAHTIYCTFAATMNGAEVATDAENPFTYSVQEYLDGRMQKSKNEKMRTLAAYLATYGAYAQLYFGINTDNLANANVETLYGKVELNPDVVNMDAAETVDTDSIETETAHIVGHALALEAATALSYTITLDDETMLPNAYLAYRVAGSESAFRYAKVYRVPKADGSTKLAAFIEDIKGPELTDAYEAYVCVKNGDAYEQISYTTVYSPECYMAGRLKKSSNEILKNTMIALKMYCDAARDYFGLDA